MALMSTVLGAAVPCASHEMAMLPIAHGGGDVQKGKAWVMAYWKYKQIHIPTSRRCILRTCTGTRRLFAP